MRKEKSEKEVKSKETGRSPVPILDLERQQTPRTWALALFSIFSVFNMSWSPCPKVCRHPFTRDLVMIPMQHCNAVMLADATAKTRASSHNGLVLLFVAHRDSHIEKAIAYRDPGTRYPQKQAQTTCKCFQVSTAEAKDSKGLQRLQRTADPSALQHEPPRTGIQRFAVRNRSITKSS